MILPLKTDFEIPPRAVVMCTLRGVSPTSAANRFMDFVSEEALAATGRWNPDWNGREVNPGHEYRVTAKFWKDVNAGQVYEIPYLVNYGASAGSAEQAP